MSYNIDEAPVEPPAGEELSRQISHIDQIRSEFFRGSAAYVQAPSGEYCTGVNDVYSKSTAYLTAMYEFTQYILDDELSSYGEKADILGAVYLDEENKRVNCFNSLFRSKDKQIFSSRTMTQDAIATRIFNDLNNYSSGVYDYEEMPLPLKLIVGYANKLELDVNKLIELGDTKPRIKAKNIGRLIGEHSLGALKIGTGVAISSVIIKEIERRRKQS